MNEALRFILRHYGRIGDIAKSENIGKYCAEVFSDDQDAKNWPRRQNWQIRWRLRSPRQNARRRPHLEAQGQAEKLYGDSAQEGDCGATRPEVRLNPNGRQNGPASRLHKLPFRFGLPAALGSDGLHRDAL